MLKGKISNGKQDSGPDFLFAPSQFPSPIPTGVSQWTACVEIRTDTPQPLPSPPPKYISCEIRKLWNVSELKMLALLMEAWKG